METHRTFKLEIGPELEDWFLSLAIIHEQKLLKHWCISNATLAKLLFFHVLDSDPSVNSLGSNRCSQERGSFNFQVSSVLDLSMNPPHRDV
jgi:hypothetical protein